MLSLTQDVAQWRVGLLVLNSLNVVQISESVRKLFSIKMKIMSRASEAETCKLAKIKLRSAFLKKNKHFDIQAQLFLV